MNNVVRGLNIQVDFDEANNKIEVDASGDIWILLLTSMLVRCVLQSLF